MDLNKTLLDFLLAHCDQKHPLLLALSGGGDSMALFYLLIESGWPFEVAHVNHGWRAESGEEAAYLEQLCRTHQISFHLHHLYRDKMKGNLEDLARQGRLLFFRNLCTLHSFQGVLLGHHADDQAETVLKRIFEGASLPKLKGLERKTLVEGVRLFRPFLKIRKDLLINWLHEKNRHYFEDATNQDTSYLRARCRHQLLPLLSETFGKEISPSLCRIGEYALELQEFMEYLLTPYRQSTLHTNEEISLNFSHPLPQTSFIFKAVIRDFCERQKLTLSQSMLETIYDHLRKRSVGKTIQIGKRKLGISRGVLILKVKELDISEINN